MLERRDYRAGAMAVLIVCGFIKLVTGYVKSPRMVRVHAMYMSLMSRVLSDSWKEDGRARN